MFLLRPTLLTSLLILVFISTATANDFVGSEACSECHQEIFDNWQETGHGKILRPATQAKESSLPLPNGYVWQDISYVVGGYRWQALYLDKNGYLITNNKNGEQAPTLYNINENTWSNYLTGTKKNYECAGCHTTGYVSDGHQNDLIGIVGRWAEDGIGCEGCHGSGRAHIEHPQKRVMATNDAIKSCERCHQHGGISHNLLQEVGLNEHHHQLNELKSGAHKGLSCTNCHDPHKRSVEAKRNCTICHSRLNNSFINNKHSIADVTCIDCHMANVRSAAISRTRYIGGTKTHLFKINTHKNAEMFKTIKEGDKESVFIKGFLTVEHVCLNCHDEKDKTWAVDRAKNFHGSVK